MASQRVDPIPVLERLVRTPSLSGDEAALAALVHDLLRGEGFAARMDPLPDGRANVRLDVGQPMRYLASHLDTVPGLLPVRITRQAVHGRGACDAKASVAAMMAAAVQARDAGTDGFGLIFTVGEEVDMAGARQVGPLPFVVVGEPTHNRLLAGQFTDRVVRLEAVGRTAHASRPEDGVNAIELLQEEIDRLRAVVPPPASFAVTRFHGGSADNVVPDRATASVDVRHPADMRLVLGRSPKGVKRHTQTTRGVATTIPAAFDRFPQGGTARFSTELTHYRRGVVFGPGSIQEAHTAHESVRKEDVRNAVDAYAAMLQLPLDGAARS